MELDQSYENPVNGEHLIDSRHIIRACITNAPEVDKSVHPKFKSARYVDFWYWYDEDESRRSIEHTMRSDTHSCTISYIDERDKWSREYRNCTAVVAIGKGRKTGKNQSFLTHQDPVFFLSDTPHENSGIWKSEYYARKLRESLSRLIDSSEEGSVDVVIFGGQSLSGKYDEYKESILFLDDTIGSLTGVSPTVIAGPTDNSSVWNNDKAVYVDTENRRVHFYRQYHHTDRLMHFTAGRVEEVIATLKRKSN